MRRQRQTPRSTRNVEAGEKEPSRRMIWVELARTEILDATEQLLKKVPFSELNVTMVMAQTRLARSSFYEYFKDLHEVLVSLTGRMLQEMAEQNSVVDSRMPSAADRVGYLAALRDKYVIYWELHRKHRHLYRALVAARAFGRQSRAAHADLSRIYNSGDHGKYLERPEGGRRKGTERRGNGSGDNFNVGELHNGKALPQTGRTP